MQISEPCYGSIKATNTFIYSLSLLPRFRFRTGVPKLSLAMYPFSISIDEHTLRANFPTHKISYDKKIEEYNKNIFTNKHDFENNIHR